MSVVVNCFFLHTHAHSRIRQHARTHEKLRFCTILQCIDCMQFNLFWDVWRYLNFDFDILCAIQHACMWRIYESRMSEVEYRNGIDDSVLVVVSPSVSRYSWLLFTHTLLPIAHILVRTLIYTHTHTYAETRAKPKCLLSTEHVWVVFACALHHTHR